MSQEHRRNSGGFLINIIFQFTLNPSTHLRQKLVHPKDKTPRHKQRNVVYAVQCSQDCTDLNFKERKQPLHKQGTIQECHLLLDQDKAVHLYLKEKNNFFKDNNVNILVREDRWFERVKESFYVKLE